MIIKTKKGNILEQNEKRIAFAINTEGVNDEGFAGMISDKFWPELAYIGKTKLGTVLIRKVGDVEFFALCCHSIKKGWKGQQEIIKKCFDSIPGNDPVASILGGNQYINIRSKADSNVIKNGMEASKKEIILY